MKCRLSSMAQTDLDDIWYFIARDNPEAADHFLDTLEEKLILLAAHPNLGRKCEEVRPGLQRLPAGAYVIFYRLGAKHLEIVRILHAARDIEAAFRPEEDSG